MTSSQGTNATGNRAKDAGTADLDGYAAAAPMYWERGWRGVLPLRRGTKAYPPKGYTGRAGIEPSYPDVDQWGQLCPDGNIALRLPPGVIGIDVDDYGDKTGGQTLAEAQKRWGALPPTIRSSSRDGISGIRLYRIPEGIELQDRIKLTLDDGQVLGGIEVIQYHHRYVVGWPSIHPDGPTYQWRDEDGPPVGIPDLTDDDVIPDLPPAWLAELSSGRTGSPHNGVNGNPRNGVGAPYDVTEAMTAGTMSAAVKVRLADAVAACQDVTSESRHDAVRDHVLAVLHLGKDGEPGVMTALLTLRELFVAAVAPDREGGATEATREFNRMVTGDRMARLLTDSYVTMGADGSIGGQAPADNERQGNTDKEPGDNKADGTATPTALEKAIAKRLLDLTADKRAKEQMAEIAAVSLPEPELYHPAKDSDRTPHLVLGVFKGGEASSALLAARRKAGKSTTTDELVYSLVTGEKFCGVLLTRLPKGAQVVVIDTEMSKEDIDDTYVRCRPFLADGTVKLWMLIGIAGLIDTRNERALRWWVARIPEGSVIVIDCLSPILSAAGIAENSDAVALVQPRPETPEKIETTVTQVISD